MEEKRGSLKKSQLDQSSSVDLLETSDTPHYIINKHSRS